MKTCPKCLIAKDDAEYGTRPNGNLKAYCLLCMRQYSKDHYQANRASAAVRTRRNQKARRSKIREHVRAIKDVPCVDCMQRFPSYVMQFDHLPQHTKKGMVANMVGGLASWRRVKEEISKCDVVCANCHAIRTFTRRGL